MNPTELLAGGYSLLSRFNETAWNLWMMNLGSLTWFNEQFENLLRVYLDQNHQTREELVKLLEELTNQAQKGQQQMQELYRQIWSSSYESWNYSGLNPYFDLVKEVDHLLRKVSEKTS